ncbi:MAG TPA: pilus assembly protein PilM [Myxococcota bacterium]|jgi:Tfp pilus assembly PilM family ATPase
MPMLKNVLGLDLGSHSIKAVELQQTFRGASAAQLRCLPRVGDEVPLPEMIRRFVVLHQLSTAHVVSALRADRISSRRLSFPFADRRKLDQAVAFEVEGDVALDLEQVVVDWAIVGGDKSRADVVASIAPRAEVSELIETLRAGGCEPRTLEAEGFVLGNLTAAFDLPGTRLLVDLGHRKTTFCLLVDGKAVAARSVPVAGAALTEALAKDRLIGPADAERVKCEDGVFGGSLADAPARTAAVLDTLAREVVRTLGAFEPLISGGGPPELTLFGGTAQLDRIDEYLSERTGLAAARLGLPTPGGIEGLAASGSPVLYAPGIALALRGTAQATTRMNFRQDEFALRLDLVRQLRDFRPTLWLGAAAAVLAAVSFGTSTLLEARRASAIEDQAGKLWTQAFPSKPVPANLLAAMREEVAAAGERAEFLGVYAGNLSALDVLTEISKRVPADLDVVFEELAIDKQMIRMRVQAKSFEAADRLGQELAKFPPFAKARIGAIETDNKTGAKRFNVTIGLAPEGERE